MTRYAVIRVRLAVHRVAQGIERIIVISIAHVRQSSAEVIGTILFDIRREPESYPVSGRLLWTSMWRRAATMQCIQLDKHVLCINILKEESDVAGAEQ
mmetsp:Transcript_42255/g.68532  ORF Transcript_42255/g.68532 Transcript_42255/m.68532 type:complete len:98 (+) Transcript_42255:323-616(+)|eukprot:CAMPEP_0184652342 /NCGR_PEP_ID=MMETSP0308-20130426/10050_1 /TAXON_ID=38269 /ORGANISM="Gloeochaete witrockiana, Strain SAG 46.84" /LENGTH=97 /DNA_ID=CAMNT_0027087173 /DNA_START=361 /DNA_END=654 /DNA_ORIENTATION=-